MAKDNDFDVDDFDLDNFDFDVPSFEDSDPVSEGSRSPVTRALKGTVRGAKAALTDASALKRSMSLALPEGYGLAVDTIDSAITDTKDLYDKIKQDSPGAARASKSFARRAMGTVGNRILPPGIAKRLNESLEDNDFTIQTDDELRQEREQSEIAALNELFKAKTEADEYRLKEEKAEQLEGKLTDQARFALSTRYMKSINTGIGRLVGYQDKITLGYQQKSLELQYRHFAATKQMSDMFSIYASKQESLLEQIKHNTALPEAVKIRGSEMFGQLARERLMGSALNNAANFTSNYRKQVMDNVSGMMRGLLAPLGMVQDGTLDGIDKVGMGGEVVGQQIAETLMDHAAMAASPFLAANPKIRQGSEYLRTRFSGMAEKANEFALSETKGTGAKAIMTQMFKDFMPKYSLDTNANPGSVQMLDQPATWDRISRRTLIEVIPGYLSDIAHWTRAAVTGEVGEKRVYSMVRGGFTTESENLKDVGRQIVSRQERDALRSATDDFIQQIGGDTLSEKAQRGLKRRILEDSANVRDLKPERLIDPESYPDLDPESIDEIISLVTDTFNLDWDGKQSDNSPEARAKFNDIARSFYQLKNMIPDVGNRVRILSDMLGRDNLRSLNYIERTDRQDQVGYNKFLNSILDNQDSATPGQPSLTASLTRPNNNALVEAYRAAQAQIDPQRAEENASVTSERSTPMRGDMSRWLGEKSLVVGVLREQREGLAAIHNLLSEWDMTGIKTANGDLPPAAQRRMRSFFDRFKGFKRPNVEQGRSFMRSIGEKVGGTVGWATGKAAGLGVWGAAQAAKLGFKGFGASARLGLGMLGGIGGAMRDQFNSMRERGMEGISQWGQALPGQLRGVRDSAGAALGRARDRLMNVYLEGEKHPRLLAWKLKAGEYYDETSGKVIEKWQDIQGNVIDKKNELVMSYKEFVESGGLRDAKGRVVARVTDLKNRGVAGAKGAWGNRRETAGKVRAYGQTKLDRAREMLGETFSSGQSLVMAPYRLMGKALGGTMNRLMKFFKGRGGSSNDISNKLVGDFERDMVMLNLRQSQVQYDIYDLLNEHLGGSKVRKGSFQDIFARREAARQARDEQSRNGRGGIFGGLFGAGAAGLGALGKLFGGGKKRNDDEDEEGGGGDNYGYVDLGGGDKDDKRNRRGKGGKPKGRLGRLWQGAKSLGGRALSALGWAGSALKWGGKAALGAGKLAWNVGKFALTNPVTRFVAGTVGRLALGAVMGLGSLVSAPVLAGAALVGGLAVGGMWLWKRYKDRMPPLTRLRFAQYGIAPRQGSKGIDEILELEKLMARYTRVAENGEVTIDVKSIGFEHIARIFKINIDSGQPDRDRMFALTKWMSERFKTVFSAHAAQLYKLTGGLDFSTLDEKIKGKVALEVLEAVRLTEQANLFNQMESPFEFDLTEDAGDVESWYKTARSDLEDEAKEKVGGDPDKTLPGEIKAAAAPLAAASLVNNVKGKDTSGFNQGQMVSGVEGKYTPTIGLTAALAGGAKVISESSMQIVPEDRRLDHGNPVRYRVYGLTELAESKVVQLSQLESEAWPMVRYDQEGRAMISDGLALFEKAMTIFGTRNNGNLQTYRWLNNRFLPAFLKYCTAVRARASIDAKDAVKKLSNEDLLAVLKEMVDATAPDGRSVWEVSDSPWDGYMPNQDPQTVSANLTGLANRQPPKILSEAGFTEAKRLTGKAGELIKQDPTQVNRSSGDPAAVQAQAAEQAKESGGSWWDRLWGNDSKSSSSPATPSGPKTPVTTVNRSTGGPTIGGGINAVGAKDLKLGGSVKHMGGGSGGDINKIPMPSGTGWDSNKNTILAAAAMVGVDPELAASIAGVESDYNPDARPWKNRKDPSQGAWSSAGGYYQIINGTFKELMDRYGDQYGINPNATSLDPRANALLGLSYIKSNYETLKNTIRRKVTDTDVYLAHFLGLGGAKRFLTAPPTDPAINHVSQAQADANKSIFYDSSGRPRTVAEVYNQFSAKLERHRKPNAAQDMAAITGGQMPTVVDSPADEAAAVTDAPQGVTPQQDVRPQPMSLARPEMTSASVTTSLRDNSVPTSTPSSSYSLSPGAQQIGRQAEIAEIQASSQVEAITASFTGMQSLMEESLELERRHLAATERLVELAEQMALRDSDATGKPSSTSTATKSSVKPTKPGSNTRGVVGVSR